MKDARLETERLILRMYRLDDFEDHFRLCADPSVMKFLTGGKPMSRLEAWRHMAYLVGHWELLGYGYFAVEEKASSRFVGRIGLTNAEGLPGIELGWIIAPEFQGQGFATEGARVLLDHAFSEMVLDHVISAIHPGNKPSIRVAERLGEKLEGNTDVGGVPALIYGIDRPTPLLSPRLTCVQPTGNSNQRGRRGREVGLEPSATPVLHFRIGLVNLQPKDCR
jgi:RimJ/RimL family protein N-acetyltransferase